MVDMLTKFAEQMQDKKPEAAKLAKELAEAAKPTTPEPGVGDLKKELFKLHKAERAFKQAVQARDAAKAALAEAEEKVQETGEEFLRAKDAARDCSACLVNGEAAKDLASNTIDVGQVLQDPTVFKLSLGGLLDTAEVAPEDLAGLQKTVSDLQAACVVAVQQALKGPLEELRNKTIEATKVIKKRRVQEGGQADETKEDASMGPGEEPGRAAGPQPPSGASSSGTKPDLDDELAKIKAKQEKKDKADKEKQEKADKRSAGKRG